MRLGNGLATYFCYVAASVGFFNTTLEEYYTHVMYLPALNGATEGILIVSGFILLPAYYGIEFWN